MALLRVTLSLRWCGAHALLPCCTVAAAHGTGRRGCSTRGASSAAAAHGDGDAAAKARGSSLGGGGGGEAATLTGACELRFAPLRVRTPEAIAYAACPVCGRTVHMLDMLVHLTSTHRGLDVTQCRRLCDERLQLYHRIAGVPLQKLGSVYASSVSSSSSSSSVRGHVVIGGGGSVTPAAGAVAATSTLARAHTPLSHTTAMATAVPALVADEAQLPTLTEHGYLCNWCVCRGSAYATRDAFLLHVARVHPNVDVDAIEPYIPPLPTHEAAHARHHGDGGSQAGAAGSHHTVAEAGTSAAAPSSSWGIAGTHASAATTRSTGPLPGPTRRLRRDDDGEATPTHVDLSRRTTAPADVTLSMQLARRPLISVPRHITQMRIGSVDDAGTAATAAEDKKNSNNTNSNSNDDDDDGTTSSPRTTTTTTVVMREGKFTCELCLRTYVSEEQLLHHVLDRHTGEDSPRGDGAGVRNGKEGGTGGGGALCVTCDLCATARIYTLPSALYAHMRVKHPLEDAAWQVERIVAAQRTRAVFVCRYCSRAFGSQVALDGHLLDKHGVCATTAAPPLSSCPTTTTTTTTTTTAGRATAPAEAGATSRQTVGAPATRTSKQPGGGGGNSKLMWWCNECERGFATAPALHGHKVQKHQLILEVYPCPACKRTFRDVYSLQEHIKTQHRSVHVDDLGLVTHARCPDCARLFLNHDDLRRHAIKHHQRDPRLPARALERPAAASAAAAAAAVATPRAAAAPTTSEAPSAAATATTTTAESADEAAAKRPRKVARARRTATS